MEYWIMGCWAIGYWMIGYCIVVYWMIGSLDCWITGFVDNRTMDDWMLDYWIVGLLDCWIVECPIVGC
jgi:hypothetical protein